MRLCVLFAFLCALFLLTGVCAMPGTPTGPPAVARTSAAAAVAPSPSSPSSPSLYCFPCKVQARSQADLLQHMNGVRHARRIRFLSNTASTSADAAALPTPTPSASTSLPSMPAVCAVPVSCPSSLSSHVPQPLAGADAVAVQIAAMSTPSSMLERAIAASASASASSPHSIPTLAVGHPSDASIHVRCPSSNHSTKPTEESGAAEQGHTDEEGKDCTMRLDNNEKIAHSKLAREKRQMKSEMAPAAATSSASGSSVIAAPPFLSTRCSVCDVQCHHPKVLLEHERSRTHLAAVAAYDRGFAEARSLAAEITVAAFSLMPLSRPPLPLRPYATESELARLSDLNRMMYEIYSTPDAIRARQQCRDEEDRHKWQNFLHTLGSCILRSGSATLAVEMERREREMEDDQPFADLPMDSYDDGNLDYESDSYGWDC